jgi:hypothetical protein
MLAREIPSPFTQITRIAYPAAWLPKLVTLRDTMQLIGGSKIATVEALCRRLVDDYAAGDVLNELLRLFPMGSREDGGVWKKDSYWLEHFALSRYKLNKIRAKLAPFIRAEVIKSGKAPTWHYWPKPEAIVSALAKIYGKSETFIEAIVCETVEISQMDFEGFVSNRNLKNLRKSITSLTTEKTSNDADDKKIIQLPKNLISSKTKNDNAIVELLVREGIWRSVARNYSELPRHAVESIITKAIASRSHGKLRESIPVYIAACLKNYKASHEEAFRRAISEGSLSEEIKSLSDFIAFADLPPMPAVGAKPAFAEETDCDPWELAQQSEILF